MNSLVILSILFNIGNKIFTLHIILWNFKLDKNFKITIIIYIINSSINLSNTWIFI